VSHLKVHLACVARKVEIGEQNRNRVLNTSVGIAMGYWLHSQESIPGKARYLFSPQLIVETLCFKPGGRVLETRGSKILSIYLILTVAFVLGVYVASNRNEYQKHKNNVSVEYSGGRRVRLATLPLAGCEPIVKKMWDPQHLTTL
jgi:hypothetical protein